VRLHLTGSCGGERTALRLICRHANALAHIQLGPRLRYVVVRARNAQALCIGRTRLVVAALLRQPCVAATLETTTLNQCTAGLNYVCTHRQIAGLSAATAAQRVVRLLLVLQVGSCPTAAELQVVAAHLHQHRGSCEAVAAPWLYACNDARRPADADDFLLPPEALASVARYQQARGHQMYTLDLHPILSRMLCCTLRC
jgi:hypothetical protein